MTTFARRAEQISARLVGYETGATVIPYDVKGRQSAVDFLLEWPDGQRGALETTLVIEQESMAWQGMAAKEGWRWPAETSWEFRSASANFPYKLARCIAQKAVELCDTHSVDSPEDLPIEVLDAEPELVQFLDRDFGKLQRTPFSPGIVLYQANSAEFVDTAPRDFARVVEAWHQQPHMASHIEKLRRTPDIAERHLFLVPTDEVLPARFFTDDFELPASPPAGFESIDVLWIWSNYWHRYLRCRDQQWSWVDFPPRPQSVLPNMSPSGTQIP